MLHYIEHDKSCISNWQLDWYRIRNISSLSEKPLCNLRIHEKFEEE